MASKQVTLSKAQERGLKALTPDGNFFFTTGTNKTSLPTVHTKDGKWVTNLLGGTVNSLIKRGLIERSADKHGYPSWVISDLGRQYAIEQGWIVVANTMNLDASDTIHSAAASSTPEAESDAPVFAVGDVVYDDYMSENAVVKGFDDKGYAYLVYPDGFENGKPRNPNRLTLVSRAVTVNTPTSDRAIEGAVVVEAVAGQAITSMGDVDPFYHSMSKDEVFDNLVEYLCEWDFKAIVDEHVDNDTEMRVANTIFQLVASRAWEIYKQPKAESQLDTLQADLAATRSQIAALTGALETIANMSLSPLSVGTSMSTNEVFTALNEGAKRVEMQVIARKALAKQQNANDSR